MMKIPPCPVAFRGTSLNNKYLRGTWGFLVGYILSGATNSRIVALKKKSLARERYGATSQKRMLRNAKSSLTSTDANVF